MDKLFNKNISSIIINYSKPLLIHKYLQELKDDIKYIKYNGISYDINEYHDGKTNHVCSECTLSCYLLNQYINTYISSHIHRYKTDWQWLHLKPTKKLYKLVYDNFRIMDYRLDYINRNSKIWDFFDEYEDMDILYHKINKYTSNNI